MRTLTVILSLFCFSLANDDQILKDFSVGYDAFTSDVYKQLLKTNPENFIVCPLSVDTILALVTSGARGQTAEELKTALRLPENEAVYEIFKNLSADLQGTAEYDLTSANKVDLEEGFQISDSFKSIATDVFDSEIENVDFQENVQTASIINEWVENKTHDEIKDLIKPDMLNADTRAVLVNAMYFHADWLHKFDVNDNLQLPFHVNGKQQITTTMMLMSQITTFGYFESETLDAKFLKMDYKGGAVSMHIVLPNGVEGLSVLEEKLEDVLIPPAYSDELVDVKLPKFKIETEIQFTSILEAMGVNLPFSNDANFQGIAANEEKLKISEIVQKAFIEVQEDGTTAAAATGVVGVGAAGIFPNPSPKPFFVNHPFLFYLRLNKPGINFFVGRYTSP